MARQKDIRVPCAEDELEEIHRRAEEAGKTTAEWARLVLLGWLQAPPGGAVRPARDGRRRKPLPKEDT